MAIISCVLKKRTAKRSLTGGKLVRTYTAVYHLKSDIKNEDPNVVLSFPGLPPLISGWPSNPGAFLVDQDPQQEQDTPDLWVVTCSYTNSPDIRTPDQANENPLLRPAVIERHPVQRQRVIDRDVNDNLIVNLAGEKFNPPIEREEHAPAFTISKNLVTWPYAMEIGYTDGVNDSDVVKPLVGIAYAAGLLKFNGFSGGQRFENGINFWAVTGEFEVDWIGWNKKIVNVGFREKVLLGGTDDVFLLMPILGNNGEAITEPVLLSETQMTGEVFKDPYRTSPVLLDYQRYRPVPFNALLALFGI